ncbi:MAG: adenylosuccinate synthase [candidate division Zixibacteria bacterium]|nr:adenylosuccinate synthase [candidate division Zixibacteria bacterium]
MKKRNLTILGLQWGDEGKGKVVDYFAAGVDIVVRFGGGANAGHTVVNENDKFILHLLPSGILHPKVKCYMGGGMVVDLLDLFKELEEIKAKGIKYEKRLFIDHTTHLVLPQHKAIEKYIESLNKSSSINTTMKGIGPTYSDKANRIGIIASDIIEEKHLLDRIANFILKRSLDLVAVNDKSLKIPRNLLEYLKKYSPQVRDMLVDTPFELRKAIKENKRILFEGAQGSLLDIDLGTYPYVTSSNTTIGGLFTGTGMPPGVQGEVLGVVKAYTTRVGNGPFPTELDNDIGENLREKGGEYGATTGRSRRTGWLDLALVKRTAYMSGVSKLIVTKLDVLDGLDEIKICIGYYYNSKLYDFPPLYSSFMEKVEPLYHTVKGWKKPTAGITDFDQLPDEAKHYINFIEKNTEVPVGYISTGSDRKDFIEIA